uniref:Uncharacterized protein n=1 Tax=viral metagenome TaxID=1070528 RepID=A0A6H1ZRW9_9ZZZZ
MSKRIWFTQQKPFDYLPLRAGLGLITEDKLKDHPGFTGLCPKIYTTRTRPMQGEYYVVEGSRFKAKPVEPRIEFTARCVAKLWLHFRNGRIDTAISDFHDSISLDGDWYEGYTFPELDLGVKGTSFEQLRDELLRLNPKATIDSVFYVNKLEPI